jgi:hypothetical protein
MSDIMECFLPPRGQPTGKDIDMTKKNKPTSCLLWPFTALLNLVIWIISLTGRLVAVLLGLVLLILGGILIVPIVTAPIGIPIALFGLLLIVKGLW